MSAPGIVIVMAFPYRGVSEEWSQRYHLDDDFADGGDFNSTVSDLVTALQPILTSDTEFHRAYGYHDTDNDSDFEIDLTGEFGTYDDDGFPHAPGDDAFWVRWYTERHSSNGRKVYLRKYFHDAVMSGNSAGTQDVLKSTQKDAAETFANDATGTGWNGKHLAGPDGNVPGGGSAASEFITTRTLKRRGKRP
jgi:hypothetical protein